VKVIKTGKEPKPAKAWWVGKRITCPTCQTVLELEEGDPVGGSAARWLGSIRVVTINCPNCKGLMGYKEGGD
jgi:hypothetical protein